MNGTSGDGAPGPRHFPPGFLWGASTSAYQIEGAVHEDGRGQSIWDTYSHTPGKVHGGDTGDIACDSYHRLDEDLSLLSELAVDGYRFSIAWPRIQPAGRGAVNERGLDYYRALVAGLRDRGIMPVATVYHWDLPQALEDEGGWACRDTAERFAEYAQLVAQALGDQVAMWITMNEPQQAANQGYRVGTHAPGKTDYGLAAAATHHLLLGHGLALEAMRSSLPGRTAVGISLDLHPVRPTSDDALDAAAVLDAEHNRIFLEPVLHGTYPARARAELLPPAELIKPGDMRTISAPVDFLGLNYYSPYYIGVGDSDDLRQGESPLPGHPGLVNYVPPELPTTPMGWLIEPGGLYDTLVALDREAPRLPIFITENGCASDDYITPEGEVNDLERVEYLRGHLEAAWRAIQDGVNLAGYFHWSLMDNFEWARGYQRRFGLFFVDFPSQRRLAKRSARFYSEVARTGVLPPSETMLQPSGDELVSGDITRVSAAAGPVPGAL
ncbi:MAG TPA: GH1 family beta-glucosidase [Solirubrobacteraceae bacterium]|nr:GH1 family beta-glucosidase [Solirubrobacteraceae bacterium]